MYEEERGTPQNNEEAFRYACSNGELETVKWLFLSGNEISSPIDIHADNECPFRLACSYGKLETAKWLFQLGNDISSPIDIHAKNE